MEQFQENKNPADDPGLVVILRRGELHRSKYVCETKVCCSSARSEQVFSAETFEACHLLLRKSLPHASVAPVMTQTLDSRSTHQTNLVQEGNRNSVVTLQKWGLRTKTDRHIREPPFFPTRWGGNVQASTTHNDRACSLLSPLWSTGFPRWDHAIPL